MCVIFVSRIESLSMPDINQSPPAENPAVSAVKVVDKRHGVMAAISVLLSLFIMTTLLTELTRRASTVDNLTVSVSALKQEMADSIFRGEQIDKIRLKLDDEKLSLQNAKDDLINGNRRYLNPIDYGRVSGSELISVYLYSLLFDFGSFFAHDTALALSMVLAGYVGCAVGMFRQNKRASVAETTIGMASGFVVFLSIKGGHGLIVTGLSHEMPRLNPYGCTLIALVVGLFTDKAYQLLSAMVDDFSARLRQDPNGVRPQEKNGAATKE